MHSQNLRGVFYKFKPQPKTIVDLKNLVPLIWKSLSQDYIKKLTDSMSKRMRLLISKKGEILKY